MAFPFSGPLLLTMTLPSRRSITQSRVFLAAQSGARGSKTANTTSGLQAFPSKTRACSRRRLTVQAMSGCAARSRARASFLFPTIGDSAGNSPFFPTNGTSTTITYQARPFPRITSAKQLRPSISSGRARGAISTCAATTLKASQAMIFSRNSRSPIRYGTITGGSTSIPPNPTALAASFSLTSI